MRLIESVAMAVVLSSLQAIPLPEEEGTRVLQPVLHRQQSYFRSDLCEVKRVRDTEIASYNQLIERYEALAASEKGAKWSFQRAADTMTYCRTSSLLLYFMNQDFPDDEKPSIVNMVNRHMHLLLCLEKKSVIGSLSKVDRTSVELYGVMSAYRSLLVSAKEWDSASATVQAIQNACRLLAADPKALGHTADVAMSMNSMVKHVAATKSFPDIAIKYSNRKLSEYLVPSDERVCVACIRMEDARAYSAINQIVELHDDGYKIILCVLEGGPDFVRVMRSKSSRLIVIGLDAGAGEFEHALRADGNVLYFLNNRLGIVGFEPLRPK